MNDEARFYEWAEEHWRKWLKKMWGRTPKDWEVRWWAERQREFTVESNRRVDEKLEQDKERIRRSREEYEARRAREDAERPPAPPLPPEARQPGERWWEWQRRKRPLLDATWFWVKLALGLLFVIFAILYSNLYVIE